MKYSDLDFKGGRVVFSLYKGYPEHLHTTNSTLSQDMLTIKYTDYTIDVGWYNTGYMIAILDNKAEEWMPFHATKLSDHNEIFNKIQEVINTAPKLYSLKVFS